MGNGLGIDNYSMVKESALGGSRNCFLRIFPAVLFGTWSMMTTPPLRNLCGATRPRTQSWISLENAADSAPGFGFTFGTTWALDEKKWWKEGLGHKLGVNLKVWLKGRTLVIQSHLSQNTPPRRRHRQCLGVAAARPPFPPEELYGKTKE